MAIFLGNKQPEWPNAVCPSGMFPHYGQRQGYPQNQGSFMPGFSDDAAAGSTIKISWVSGYYPQRFDYYDKGGDAITTGIWNGGVVPGDFAGAEQFRSFYMDTADELLYLLVQDTGTSPDSVQLVNINKEGVIGTYSAAWDNQYSGTSFDGIDFDGYSPLIRATSDGSGDFRAIYTKAMVGSDAAAGAHGEGLYRGASLVFDETSGVLTESHLLPDTAQGRYWYNNLNVGPTSNNIMGGLYGLNQRSMAAYGPLVNISTGNGAEFVEYPTPNPLLGSTISVGAGLTMGRWRGHYFSANTYAYGDSVPFFTYTDMHNMLDEMAVKHGLL